MKNKLLFFQWNAFMQEGIENALKRANAQYDIFFYLLNDWDKDDKLSKLLKEKLQSESYSAVFSVNFAPVISNVCMECGVRYISWVYDAPLHIRNVESLKNSCNDIYFFDAIQCESYQNIGVNGAHHLPLAVDEDVFSDDGINHIIEGRKNKTIIGNVEKEKPDNWYDCDVALVGKLYKSDYQYLLGPLDLYLRGYLEGVVESQRKLFGGYIIGEMLTNEIIEKMNAQYKKASNGKFKVIKEEVEFALGTEVTGRDRFMALALLQNRCKVNLYSNDNDERLKELAFKGYVDYYTQMPKAFRGAKINLNMSLSLIKSGIPLRVLDVLGSKGFLITNYQPEILEYFEPGVDLVVYENIKDLVEKVKYYLSHDEERDIIALNGYNKCKNLFSFDDRIRKMGLIK